MGHRAAGPAVAVRAADLLAEDIAEGHRVAVTPEAGRAADFPAAALHLRAAMVVRQDTVAANSSRTGSRPTPHHRQEALKGASCSP